MLDEELKNQIIGIISSGALSFLSASVFSRLFIPLAFKLGAVDRGGGGRRMHVTPRARIGGICIYAACLLGAFLSVSDRLLPPILIGGGAAVVLGIIDDIRGVTPVQKLIIQVISAWLALGTGVPIPALVSMDAPPVFLGNVIQTGAAVLWITLLCNGFNLIDGLDGLCASSTLGSILALMALNGEFGGALIIFAAILGFLHHNLRPARLFLGDSGAMLLGFAVAILTLDGASRGVGTIPLLLTVAYPVLETLFSAVRRIIAGRHPFAPDRGHLHHRLCDGGLSHGGASALLCLLHWGACAVAVMLEVTGWSLAAAISFALLTFALIFVIIMAKNVKSPKGA